MDQKLLDKIINVLAKNIGYKRECPGCHSKFVPNDATRNETIKLFIELKKLRDE